MKGVGIKEIILKNKPARQPERRPSIQTKKDYEKYVWQDTTTKKDKIISPELASTAKEIKQTMNEKSEQEKQNPKQPQSQKQQLNTPTIDI